MLFLVPGVVIPTVIVPPALITPGLIIALATGNVNELLDWLMKHG
jgi:hypothetical protein